MPRIKHVAIRTADPAKTAAFCKEVFGLEEVGLARAGYYLRCTHQTESSLHSNSK